MKKIRKILFGSSAISTAARISIVHMVYKYFSETLPDYGTVYVIVWHVVAYVLFSCFITVFIEIVKFLNGVLADE